MKLYLYPICLIVGHDHLCNRRSSGSGYCRRCKMRMLCFGKPSLRKLWHRFKNWLEKPEDCPRHPGSIKFQHGYKNQWECKDCFDEMMAKKSN